MRRRQDEDDDEHGRERDDDAETASAEVCRGEASPARGGGPALRISVPVS
jgi:hypothetical protein